MNENKHEVTILDFVFVGAALMMYSKTADVFVFFTPQIVLQMFGNVQQWYGMANAAFVEIVMGVLHFHPGAQGHVKANTVKWTLFSISLLCQVYDGWVTTDTLSLQTDTVKAIFINGVPAITPLLVAMLLWMGKLPVSRQFRDKKPFVGLKNIPGQFRWLWEGQNVRQHNAPVKPMVTQNSDTDLLELEVETKANPSPRRNGTS